MLMLNFLRPRAARYNGIIFFLYSALLIVLQLLISPIIFIFFNHICIHLSYNIWKRCRTRVWLEAFTQIIFEHFSQMMDIILLFREPS
ncbi:hypothetical protein HZS_6490 [Henneguya salminicola]|nr:hypothetical protein HZS_6490 [Henneguya salminicola]